jgi:TolB-like protein
VGIASLAVVPFESLTPELDRSAVSRGLTDLLVADLSKIEWVQVISPSTVRRYTWLGISTGLMGRVLGLEVLVEGTVQKVGERLTITARLVDVHTGKLIWAEDYDYPAADWGQLQGEAARKVAAQVGAHLAIQGRFPRSDR